MSDSVRLYGPWPSRLLCPWGSSGKSTGMDCHALLQGIFPSYGWSPCVFCLPHWQVDSLLLAPPGKPQHPRRQVLFQQGEETMSVHGWGEITESCEQRLAGHLNWPFSLCKNHRPWSSRSLSLMFLGEAGLGFSALWTAMITSAPDSTESREVLHED